MPSVNQGESRKDYMNRCIPIVIKEGADQSEAAGKCSGMWEQAQKLQDIEYTTIDNVEIAHPGTFLAQTGKVTITDDTINDFIKNFDGGIYVPYLGLDHDDRLTQRVKDSLKVNRLGSVSKLWKIGKKLMANFKDVPKGIADFINRGLMSLRSVEYRKKWAMSADEVKNNVLEAVTFFGNGKMAIDLEQYIPVLYKDEPIEQKDDVVSVKFQEEVKNMSEIKLDEQEYKDLLKKVSEVEKLKADDEANIDKIKRLEESNATMVKEKDDIVKMKEDTEKLQANLEKKAEEKINLEAEEYAVSIIKAKKTEPKYKDMIVKNIVRLQDNADELKLYKEDLESRNEIKLGITITDDTGEGDEKIALKEPDYSRSGQDGEEYLKGAEKGFYADADKKIKAELKAQKLEATSENYQKVASELGLNDEGGAE